MPATNAPLLHAEGLTVRYPGKLALDAVGFTLYRGETTAIAGGNGSGKSTLLRVLTGLLPPDGGSLRAAGGGFPAIGYAPDRFPKLKMSAPAYLSHMGAIRGMPKRLLDRRIDELHRLLRLAPDPRAELRGYSKGMLQKVNLMQALLAEAELLLLDEPLSGLDAAAQDELLGCLAALKREGLAIAVATHEPEIIGGLADRVMTLEAGRLVSDTREGGPIVLVRCTAAGNALALLGRLDGVVRAETAGAAGSYRVQADKSDAFLMEALRSGASILEVKRL